MLLKIRKITGTWQRWRWMKMKQLQSKVFKQKRHKKHHKFSSYFDPFLSLSQLGHHSPGGASTSVLAAWYGVIRSALCALCGHVDPAWFIHYILQSTPIHTNPHQTLRFLDLSICTDIHWPHQIQSNSLTIDLQVEENHFFLIWPLVSWKHLILSGQHSFDESQPFRHDDPYGTGRHRQPQLIEVRSNRTCIFYWFLLFGVNET